MSTTPVHVTVVQMSGHETRLAVTAIVCALVAIAWAVAAFHAPAKNRATLAGLAVLLGVLALIAWGIS